MTLSPGAYSGFEVIGGREMWSGRSSAEGTRMQAPKAPTGVGSGKGVFPSPVGVGSGEGLCPSPEKFWHVLLRNSAFLCILEHV